MITAQGLAAESLEPLEIADKLLASRELIGTKSWAMALLYYRAGLSQEEIGEIFGLTRQAVSSHLTRAVRVVERAGKETTDAHSGAKKRS